MSTDFKAATLAAVRIAKIVLEAIEAAGTAGIPNGHLYAMLQSILGQGWTLSVHESMIEALVDAKMITNTNHLLVAVKKTS